MLNLDDEPKEGFIEIEIGIVIEIENSCNTNMFNPEKSGSEPRKA